MKQFSNKQRVCKNKTKRHNKRNKTRKGGAPVTTNRTKKNFTTPRIPSSLGKSVTKKNTRYGVMTVTEAPGKNPIPQDRRHQQQYYVLKGIHKKKQEENEQSLSGKIASLYGRVSSVFTSKPPKPHKPQKKISLLEEVLRSTSGKAAMKATSDV